MNDCDLNADCENNEGSYECMCNEGYEGNGRICFRELTALRTDSQRKSRVVTAKEE